MTDPQGLAEFLGVLDSWQRTPGQGRLVLICGPKVALCLADASPGAQLVPPAGPGSYRQIEVSASSAAWSWRLLEDGEPVAHGTLAAPEGAGDG